MNIPNKEIALSLVIVAASLSVSGCKCGEEETDDETQIRAIIQKAATLAENHDVNGLMDLATGDFTAEPGQKDRQNVRGILFVAFRKYRKFKVKFPRPSVEVEPGGNNAEASTPFMIVRQGGDSPELSDGTDDPAGWLEKVAGVGDVYRIELSFVREDGEWLVQSSSLQGYRNINNI